MLRATCGEILVALCRATLDCKCGEDDNAAGAGAADDDDDDDDQEGGSKEESGVDDSYCSNALPLFSHFLSYHLIHSFRIYTTYIVHTIIQHIPSLHRSRTGITRTS